MNGPRATRPDHAGTLLMAGAYLLVSIVGLMLFPPSNWSSGHWPSLDQVGRTWTSPPTWDDGDWWVTNWVGHPIMGALLFLIARSRRHAAVMAALFTLSASTGWEYLMEGWFEAPSWSDLLVTPLAGSVLGELGWRAFSARSGRRASSGHPRCSRLSS